MKKFKAFTILIHILERKNRGKREKYIFHKFSLKNYINYVYFLSFFSNLTKLIIDTRMSLSFQIKEVLSLLIYETNYFT